MFTRKKNISSLRIQALILCAVMFLTFVLPPRAIYALEGTNQTGNADIVRSLSLKYMLKGSTEWNELMSPYEIEDGTKIDKFHANYSFKLNETDDGEGGARRTMKSGDYYLIDLPDKLKIISPSNGIVLGNENKTIADYSFLQKADGSWQIKIQFTEYIDNANEFEIQGHIEFDFSIDLSSVGEGTSTEIRIPIDNDNEINIGIKKPEPPKTMPTSMDKTASSYDHSTRELVWNVKMMPETGVFSDCVFTDTIDVSKLDLKDIKHGNVALIEGKDYTFDKSTGKIEYKIPKGRDGKNFQNITITTVAARSIYRDTTPKTISNKANLSGGESFVNIDSNIAEKTITPEWLKKEGTLLEGNSISWTINANITKQLMYSGVITDLFTADVKLDKNSVKLGNTQVTVYDDSHTPASDNEVYGIYKKNGDGAAELKIYLPRGKGNASNAVQTVTLKTDIVSPDNKNDKDPVYNNTASLDCKYITDGDGEGTPTVGIKTVGVPVPYISVVKGHSTITEEDKRNGTITWTISAQSNLSDYGKSQIVDTLPDDQDYIADEIYWGVQKINGTTEPKAEVSGDGRKLTITFNSNNALQQKQNFTVKTKIKKDIYGQNINRDFTNEASAALYSTAGTLITEAKDTDTVRIQNTIISKASAMYNENITGKGQNPRVNFNITINGNMMPLDNVVITDDLNKIITEFKKDDESIYNVVNNVKWTYVPNTLKITRNSGTRDNLDLADITNKAGYTNNIITVDFGEDVPVNDKYTISFTVELAVSQNDIFKENGTIRCKGNIADITAGGLKPGIIKSPATGYAPEVKNQVLEKSGVHMELEQQILWSINLNQHRVVLDNPRVEDVLPKGITLDPTSIKLYTNVIGKDGDFITGSDIEAQGKEVAFSYTYLPATGEGMEGRYKLIVDLPNNQTDYILRFATDIDRSLLGQKISNSAYYAGESDATQNNDTSTFTLSSSSGGSSVSKASVTVNKRSKDNNQNLDGAAFTLHWLRNGNTNDPVFVRTLTAANGTVIFRGLTRGEKYTITEVTPPSGYLLDSKEPVEFTVPSIGAGDAANIDFYNTPVKTGSWTPTAIKKLDGKAIIHPFQFEISDGLTTLINGVTKNKLSNGDYTVEFAMADGLNDKDVLSFTDDHIFSQADATGKEYLVTTKTFYMKEISSKLPGYGFDSRVYTLLVKVINVKGEADLKIVVEDGNGNILTDNKGNFIAAKLPSFRNTYKANGSIQLSAEKTLLGQALAAGQFSFELYEGNTLIETVSNKAGTMTAGNTYTGNIDFSPIKYTQSDVGIKTYKILENNTRLPGYTYDTAAYTVEVKIVDNDDGTLSSSVQKIKKTVNGVTTDEPKVEFSNTYTTSDIDVDLTASKALTGRTLEDKQFSFKLSQVNSEGELIAEMGTFKNNNSKITFPKLHYKQSDIGASYYYQVKEVNEGKPGYTYDSSIYTVKVDILDNHDGTLLTAQSIIKDGKAAKEIIFYNAYKAAGETQITAVKALTGKALKNQQFSFALQQIDFLSKDTIGEKTVVRNDANGSVIFPKIQYTEADAGKEFYYTIYEVDEGIGGYTYDSTAYTVLVSVTDNGDGTLIVKQSLEEGKTDIEFVNTYAASNTSVSLNAIKVINGRVLEEGQFNYVLNQVTETGTFIYEVQKAKNNKNGLVMFDDITYTQGDMGKTYYYQISEEDDKKAGYSYDHSVYDIKVEVVDNNDGTLSTLKTIQKSGESVADAVFTNTYTTSNVNIQFTASKTLKGRMLEDGQFRYALMLKGNDGKNNTLLEEVSNNKNGVVSFTPITYTQKDMGNTYYYLLSEINDNKEGYEYDNTVYTIKVTVIDNGDGTLKAETSMVKKLGTETSKVDAMQFVNQYKPPIKTDIPSTGDNSNISWYIGTVLFSIASLFLLNRKRIKN